MNNLDIVKLVNLVESDKIDEATQEIKSYFESLSLAERGQGYVTLATMYMDMVETNQKKMAALLELQLMHLKEIDKAEKTEGESLELEQLRTQLK